MAQSNPSPENTNVSFPDGFPVVAVGASAGGLEAFTELLRHLPADTGMAFVLIQHLSPGHASMLAQLLSRETAMPVNQVEDGAVVADETMRTSADGVRCVLDWEIAGLCTLQDFVNIDCSVPKVLALINAVACEPSDLDTVALCKDRRQPCA